MLKKILFILYAIVIIMMAMATFVERSEGTEWVAQHFYGSWWFSLLWALLAAAGAAYIIVQKMRRPSLIMLHASFVVILLGALLTHLTSEQGIIHLRIGEENKELGFGITLKSFDVKYHEGTMAPYDFVSRFVITDGDESPSVGESAENSSEGMVSMNNIYSYNSYRLYQNSYDKDGRGSYLSYNGDPWGIPITYTGYALLFISLVWMMFDSKGRFRRVLSSLPTNEGKEMQALSKKLAGILLFSLLPTFMYAESVSPTISETDAAVMARLNIDYNERICPMETFALDFCKTVTGARSYEGLNATQVLAGYLLFNDKWMTEPCIKVKSGELRERLNLQDHLSVASLFNGNHEYILGPYVQEYYQGNSDAFHKAVADLDEKVMLVMQVQQQMILKIFPYKGHWYAPTDKLPADMNKDQQEYIHSAVSILAMLEHSGVAGQSTEMLHKMHKYQYRYGGQSIPSNTRLQAEHIYNTVPFATILAILCLCCGIINLFWHPRRISLGSKISVPGKMLWRIALVLCWLTLTFTMALRWIISGTVPMANGYESMLMMAWLVMIMAMLLQKRFPVIMSFGFLLSGFFLLVSHISQMTPAINHIMPVLESPLLSVHVSIIMMSYALLSITAICAAFALVSKKKTEEMTRLSVLMLYPAMVCLGIGIFVGAIWANVSWGTYWSWDPKETWALITFMIYAVPLHTVSLPIMRKSRAYHIYILCAFLSVIITYFGVNYLMTGMHSYA